LVFLEDRLFQNFKHFTLNASNVETQVVAKCYNDTSQLFCDVPHFARADKLVNILFSENVGF
jgi:hypothetical protein